MRDPDSIEDEPKKAIIGLRVALSVQTVDEDGETRQVDCSPDSELPPQVRLDIARQGIMDIVKRTGIPLSSIHSIAMREFVQSICVQTFAGMGQAAEEASKGVAIPSAADVVRIGKGRKR